jgi:hypothetical protein
MERATRQPRGPLPHDSGPARPSISRGGGSKARSARPSRRIPLAVAASIAGTLSITLLILNLSSGERKIEYRIAPLYATGEAQFIRALGNLLGPPLVDGNRVTELKNGDEICPAMLEAIRGARRPTQDHAGDLHLLVGNHRQRVHGRAVRASPQRRPRPRSARLGGNRKDGVG